MMSFPETVNRSYAWSTFIYNIGLVMTASFLIGLSAQLEMRLPFTPIPITAQTLVVLMSGALLGAHRGVLAILVYLAAGVSGLPVFSGFGASIHHILGPSGGYLMGFAGGAYIAGTFVERGWDTNFLSRFSLMLLSCCAIYATGLLWLGFFVGFEKALAMGLIPFMAGDIIKSALAAFLLGGKGRLLNNRLP